MIAKVRAYVFSNDSLWLFYSYLNKRWHRTKLYRGFSSWKELNQRVPQGSVLGSLLFNICLNDLFFLSEFTDLCNFADGTTFYAWHMDLNSLTKRLEYNSFLAIEWFENYNMKLNQSKYHFLVSEYKNENVWERERKNLGK